MGKGKPNKYVPRKKNTRAKVRKRIHMKKRLARLSSNNHNESLVLNPSLSGETTPENYIKIENSSNDSLNLNPTLNGKIIFTISKNSSNDSLNLNPTLNEKTILTTSKNPANEMTHKQDKAENIRLESEDNSNCMQLNNESLISYEELFNQSEEVFEVEKEGNNYSRELLPSKRVICNMAHVITQARKLEKHPSTCKFGGMLVFKKMVHKGIATSFHYACSKKLCGKTAIINSDKDGESLNKLAVIGAISTGSGFTQEEEKFNIMNVHYMNRLRFHNYEKLTDNETCAQDKL